MTKQVICINWGTKYGPVYINRLYGMVSRNVTPPFSFTCFTDNAEGIRPEVDCQPLPPIDVEIPATRRGIWPKARLWGPNLGTLTGNVLFLDLDLVITGSLDDFFSYGDPDAVILSRNPTRPFERLGQTSLFRFPVGKLVPLQERFSTDPAGVAAKYVYEQRYVTQCAPGGVDLFPARWVRHFRRFNVRTFPLNYFLEPRIGRDTRVVIFPGHLFPEDAVMGGWAGRRGIGRIEHLAGWRRLRRAREGVFAYFRHYMLPTSWVRDIWRD